MQITFTASLARRSDALDLGYVIENHGNTDIGLFNWIPWSRPDGTVNYPSSTAYVELVEDVLLLRKMVLPVPPGLRVTAPPNPYATRIPARSTFTERIYLNVPVAVLQPHRAATLRLEHAAEVVADAPAKARLLRLEIGVFPIDEGIQLIPENPAHPHVLTVFPPHAAVEAQRSLLFDTALDRPLRVLDYRVAPWADPDFAPNDPPQKGKLRAGLERTLFLSTRRS